MAQQTFTPLSNMEISAFCSQMAMILQSGISSVEEVTLMLEESKSPDEQELLTNMQKTLFETGSFYEALVSTGSFPDYMLQMVNIGEQTGKLDDVMKSLSEHYDREAAIAQSVKNAVTYPLIMICMMLLVIVVLITKVMPIFNQVFRQLGSEMTGFSKAILNLGTALNRYSVIFIAALVILIIFVILITRTKSGRAAFGRFTGRFAWTRSVSEKMAACRFASGMALTLSSGMTQSECLELTSKLTDNENFRQKLEQCQIKMQEGEDLSQVLLEMEVFSGIYARMASIGSKAGVLDEVMSDIADRYQEEIDQRFTNIIATLEPTLVIILSLIVGMILLSVMLPLMGIMSSI